MPQTTTPPMPSFLHLTVGQWPSKARCNSRETCSIGQNSRAPIRTSIGIRRLRDDRRGGMFASRGQARSRIRSSGAVPYNRASRGTSSASRSRSATTALSSRTFRHESSAAAVVAIAGTVALMGAVLVATASAVVAGVARDMDGVGRHRRAGGLSRYCSPTSVMSPRR